MHRPKSVKGSTLNQRIGILFLLTFFLSSCADKYQIKDVDMPIEDQCIVFGNVTFDIRNKLKFRHKYLLILPSGSNIIYPYKLTKSSYFYMGLMPGEYTILYLHSHEKDLHINYIQSSQVPIRASFTVAEGTKSLYVGDIAWNETTNNLIIKDDFQSAFEAFKKRFPNEQGKPSASLMRIKILNSYEYVKSICSSGWGIKCTLNYQGVYPWHPTVKESSRFATKVNSLIPTLEWQPSVWMDVTYDLMIFESAYYHSKSVGRIKIPGRIIVYEENMTESKYQLKKPLEPNSQYYWTVRLRRKNVVSTWSKFSYFSFSGMDLRSGTNLLYSFSTPEIIK